MRSVYIVRCNDATLYTGIAKDLDKRISDHNISKSGAKYTKARRPVVLVWSYKAKDRNIAAKLEYKIKRLPKIKKEEMATNIFLKQKHTISTLGKYLDTSVFIASQMKVKNRNVAAQLEYTTKRIGKTKKEALVGKKPRKKNSLK